MYRFHFFSLVQIFRQRMRECSGAPIRTIPAKTLLSPCNSTLTMFADDTSITQSSSTIHELNARLNRDASGVFAWANLNDMALNTSKTKSLLITTQDKFHRLNDHSLNVMINAKLNEQVQHAKLLGVTLDSGAPNVNFRKISVRKTI